jgi:hypothetical protein
MQATLDLQQILQTQIEPIKQAIQLSLATLVLSLTFVDKILDVHNSPPWKKGMVVAIWLALAASIVLGFYSLTTISVSLAAGHTSFMPEPYLHKALLQERICVDLFVASLAGLIVLGAHSLVVPRN